MLKQLSIILTLLILIPFSSRATHVMGADIGWKSLGHDSFEIIIHAYRDCNGMQMSGKGLSYYTPGDTCVSTAISVTPDVCCGTDITPVCKNSCDRCQSSSCTFAYGVQEWTITATVYLAGPCCNYAIVWQENSRSSNITTGAADDNFYEEVYLNRCVKPGDNSPYFSAPPMAIFCTNQCVVYNQGAFDIDTDAKGRPDSLAYLFGKPQSAQGKNISYNYPYAYNAPVIYAGTAVNEPFVLPACYGFHLDSSTGDISFKALKPDISLLAIMVDEYRRDSSGKMVKIGEIKRDMEILVLDCPSNHPPIIAGINGGSANSIKICANAQTCFQIKAFDLDLPDTDSIAWNNPPELKGASFSVIQNGQKWPTANFCWKPSTKKIRALPYRFVAYAIDNECPVPGRTAKEFLIYVSQAAPKAKYTAIVGKCGSVSFDADATSDSPMSISSYSWTGSGAPGEPPMAINNKYGTYQYISGGTYHYTLTVTGTGGCTSTYNDSITIPKYMGIKLPHDTTVCINTILPIKAIPVNMDTAYKFQWNTGSTDTIIYPIITRDTAFTALIRDSSGCSNFNTIHIHVLPYPKAITGANRTVCAGDTLTIGGSAVSGNTYYWSSYPAGFTSTLSSVKIKPESTTLYTLNEINAIGCRTLNTVRINVNPLPDAYWDMAYIYDDAWFYARDSSLSNSSYVWEFGDNLAAMHGQDSAVGRKASHIYPHIRAYQVRLTVTNTFGCANSLDSTVLISYAGVGNNDLDRFSLSLFPNPFSTSTTLQYSLLKPSNVKIELYEITGKRISVIENKQLETGNYSFEINASEHRLHPGIYILKFITDDGNVSREMVKF